MAKNRRFARTTTNVDFTKSNLKHKATGAMDIIIEILRAEDNKQLTFKEIFEKHQAEKGDKAYNRNYMQQAMADLKRNNFRGVTSHSSDLRVQLSSALI